MATLRRHNRPIRNSSSSIKSFVLLIAATIFLVFWAYQRLYFGKSTHWLLITAILLAVLAFGMAFYNIFRVWRKHN